MSTAPARAAPPPPPTENGDGASPRERLFAAAKTDNEDLLLSALDQLLSVNAQDGLGNTALHYAVIHGSTDVLEHIVDHDSCEPDIPNNLDGETPLHIAVRQRWEDQPGVRLYIVGTLLEGGANMLIKNRHGERPIDLLPPYREGADPNSDDEKVRAMIRRAQAEAQLGADEDIARDYDDDDMYDPNDVASDSD
ncbi:ankyrin [Cutaneotrichosporon oleaginosum]|uniref:Ankyrin n=1 Tax=Cutaneotrichosporon oleaginosum TaxID=879819 RepID=A0A0J0XBX9_9TREE|nr:ankyrin [Cutaneotrichosporon oleaginosum]KLT38565.1 ankyrin [Cutaneotrichosporon oleaginosum]